LTTAYDAHPPRQLHPATSDTNSAQLASLHGLGGAESNPEARNIFNKHFPRVGCVPMDWQEISAGLAVDTLAPAAIGGRCAGRFNGSILESWHIQNYRRVIIVN
jgi:hypothetical protein